MNRNDVLTLLNRVKQGEVSPDDAIRQVERDTFEDLGFAKLDHQRSRRLGFPEVVYAEGKADDHLLRICEQHLKSHKKLLVTRLAPARAPALLAKLPGGHLNGTARTLSYGLEHTQARGHVAVVCAGTSDLPVAEEALETARLMDCHVELTADVGVAGLHRLMAHIDKIRQARVVIVVAGMEGALPSVVGGLVRAPLIAVPTSIGYGASFGGLAALLAMMNSCAAGVTVVNIDNGFGAGFAAALINNPVAE